MKSFKNTSVTVKASIDLPVEIVWDIWTMPEHITRWCQASDDWHAPYAENKLIPGGKFKTTMAARDGSTSFDFEGVYTQVLPHQLIEYILNDGRFVSIQFSEEAKRTIITETFDIEDINSPEIQKDGWQAILDNFKTYAEAWE